MKTRSSRFRRSAVSSMVVVGVVACLFAAQPAAAAPRAWVSSSGSGIGCTRALPCATFQQAHNTVDFGGEVNCVNPGDYGTVVISKPITIDCSDVGASISAPSGTAISSTTSGIVISVRGLSINGFGTGSIGIQVQNVSELHVENCRIMGFRGGEGIGIKVGNGPGGNSAIQTYVTNTVLQGNGLPGSGGGLGIVPNGAGQGSAVLNGVQAKANTYGIWGNGFVTTGNISMEIHDSVAAENAFAGISGFTASGTGVVGITVDGSSSLYNNTGILAHGPSTFMILGRSTVASNQTGLNTIGGGTIFSYHDNKLNGNVTAGVAPVEALSVR